MGRQIYVTAWDPEAFGKEAWGSQEVIVPQAKLRAGMPATYTFSDVLQDKRRS